MTSTSWQPLVVILAVAAAIGLQYSPRLRGFQFTAWILAAVAAGMIYPERLLHIGEFDLRNEWLILFVVQAIMFGMGAQMKLADFKGVVQMPWAVGIGILGQFTIMPLAGYALIKLFRFEPEIAAGVILIGSCSAGLASNVMAYIAKANLALSITMTSVSTMLAPIMTPIWMNQLASELVEIDPVQMMLTIITIVVVPIGAAMLHDYLRFASPRARKAVHSVGAAAAVWLSFLGLGGWATVSANVSPTVLPWIGIGGFLLAAVLAGLVYHYAAARKPKLEKLMPVVAMFGIVYFTAVTTAAGRDNLLQIGGLLFLAAILHNSFGYVFGYSLARLARLDVASARTVAFEVALQNGGMASGIAGSLGKLGTMGLAPAIFSPWMNVSGSVLANWWRQRTPESAD